jgi:hypothetical protein
MGSASAVGSPANMCVAMYSATVKVANRATIHSTAKCRVRRCAHASVVAASGIEAPVSTKARSATEARTAMEAMSPRSGANKDSAGKPLWPIEAVGRASIGVIIKVTVRAHRSHPHRDRTHSDCHSESLGMRIRGSH